MVISVFSPVWASLEGIILEKIDFEKDPQKRVKGLTLTFWRFSTLFEIF